MSAIEYASASRIRRNVARAARPPIRQTVADTARLSLKLKGPGGHYEGWSEEITPYMVDPMEAITRRDVDAVVFVGPARTGKSVVIDAMIAHALTADPLDICLVHMTQDTARDYSLMRLKGIIANSPDLKRALSPIPRENNVYDKFGAAGQIVKLAWPSITQLSGKEFRWVCATDIDRMPDNIDGEGDLYGILLKRVTTYLSAGMGYFESSPGRDLADVKWKAADNHEGPPVSGIMGLYNMGDRRRLYWTCKHCGADMLVSSAPEQFELPPLGELKELTLSADLTQMARDTAVIGCKECGGMHEQSDRQALNIAGRWLPGAEESRIRSYWLGGPAAAYQDWFKLVLGYLRAVKHYARTGDEEPLRRSITQDFGGIYKPQHLKRTRPAAEDIRARAETSMIRHVPAGVRFLIPSADVQGNRFVFQVVGFGPGKERWIIDRYRIGKSDRRDESGNILPIDPAAYLEDWMFAIKEAMQKRYPLADGSGRSMPIALLVCDSGGKEGVTSKAYEFHRWIAAKPDLAPLFRLIKGEHRASAPRVEERWPDTRSRKDRDSGARGDVPVLFINTNIVKDALAGDLQRKDPGPGYIHFPGWLGQWFFDELTAEERDPVKGWTQTAKRNEAWDLLVYAEAAAIQLGIEEIDWDNPPSWADEWDNNPFITEAATKPVTDGRRLSIRGRHGD